MPAGAHTRPCEVCGASFTPRLKHPDDVRCRTCRSLTDKATAENEIRAGAGFDAAFVPIPVKSAPTHSAAPMRQVVFDLETFALDRGWGVILMAHFMVHGDGEVKWFKFDARQAPGWPDVRDDDSWITTQCLSVLKGCHIAYAHNGRNFDIPYLNSSALKYGIERLKIKLIDPVQIARKNYRIGNNSLSALADFLDLEESKLHLSPDVWRKALFNNDQAMWDLLAERCTSDVELLNAVASRVTSDVGMVDYGGSAWR